MTNVYDGNGNVIEVGGKLNDYEKPIIVGNLPYVYITSETPLSSVSKTKKSTGTIKFINNGNTIFELPCSYKAQGEYSNSYDKKSLNITLLKEDGSGDKQKVQFGNWYKHSKYHIKGNPEDALMCRRAVAEPMCKLWLGQNLPLGAMGYTDAFPIIMYYNGEWCGCYTWNLSQDGKLFNFSDSLEDAGTQQAWRNGSNPIGGHDITIPEDWEYRGDADENEINRAKINELISWMYIPSQVTKERIEANFDVRSLLGYMILRNAMMANDCIVNNTTMVTWDGKHFYHVLYDLDSAFPSRELWLGADSLTKTDSECASDRNPFFAKVRTLYADEIREMYADFRRNGLDVETVDRNMKTFLRRWGFMNISDNWDKWTTDKERMVTEEFNYDMMISTFTKQLARMDTAYGFTQ